MSPTTTAHPESRPTIGVVGVCGSGKTELARRLRARGYVVRHIAQEHSYAPKMWQRRGRPDALIYLHVSFPITMQRKSFHWNESEYQEQLRRLADARQHADLTINTDHLTPEEVAAAALDFIEGDTERPEQR